MEADWPAFVKKMIRSVPRGKVATYGQIAALSGRPRHARHVGRLLREVGDESRLPWHRIINGQGAIALGAGRDGHEQRRRLEAEGVVFKANGRVDLKQYGWRYSE